MSTLSSLLTHKEAIAVEAALLTSQDKFLVRVALYALRSLKQIAQRQGVAISAVTTSQIEAWMAEDTKLQSMDASFQTFFTRLVLAAQPPLTQVAIAAQVPEETLTPGQVIAWFEQEAKNREAGS